ncbi:MAG: cytidylate kinase family protein [Nitrospirota bacterium]
MSILTVSRQFGSGGREIARAVASELNYDYVDKQRILEDIRAEGAEWEKWGEALDEHCPSVWEKYDWSFRGFAALVQSIIINHALKGNVVIIGRGGNFLLKDIASAFRVRITAPLENRIDRVIKRQESIGMESAKWLIEKTEAENTCFMRTIYGKEWNDPAEYDMVFDTHAQGKDIIVSIIKTALLKKDRFAGETEELRMRAEAAKIKAALLTNPGFLIPTVDVFHEGDVIVIRGIVHSAKEHKAVEDEAKSIAKDLPVRCELHYRK